MRRDELYCPACYLDTGVRHLVKQDEDGYFVCQECESGWPWPVLVMEIAADQWDEEDSDEV